jgi:hypothetical protein
MPITDEATSHQINRMFKACAVAVVALAAAGCGGSPHEDTSSTTAPRPTSLVQVVARDNKICARFAPQIGRIAPPDATVQSTKPGQLPDAVSFLDKLLPLLRSERSQIAAVPLPVKLSGPRRNLYLSVMVALDELVVDEERVRDAAARGSLNDFRAALKRQQTDGTRLNGLAVQTGLTTCASG